MKKIVIAIVSIFLSVTASNAQLKTSNNRTSLKFQVLLPALRVDQQITKNFWLSTSFSSGFRFYYRNLNGNTDRAFLLTPRLKMEPRLFFKPRKLSRKKSRRKLKKQNFYIGFPFKVGFKTNLVNAWQSVGILEGYQAPIGKRGYIDVGFGLGASFQNGKMNVGFTGGFSIGVNLN